MGRLSGAFSRLSPRERLLVSALLAAVVVGVIVVLSVSVSGSVAKLEANVRSEQLALREIYASAGDYLKSEREVAAGREQAKANGELNLTELVANVSKRIQFESVSNRNQPAGKKRLESYLDMAPPVDEPLARPSRRKKRKDEVDPLEGYFRRDLEVSIRENVTMEAVFDFLEKIEDAKEELFVTFMNLKQSTRDPDRAGTSKIVVSTYFYREPKPE